MCRQLSGIISIQSHVTYGHAGNSVAVPVMQMLGHEVFPIHTVLFSNHTQYAEGWNGMVMPPQHITDIVKGMENIDVLAGVEAMVTGYMGSPAQVDAVIDAWHVIAQRDFLSDKEPIWVLDPVMPDPNKGCKMADGMPEAWREVVGYANVITPNQYELSQLTQMEINTLDDLKAAITHLRKLSGGADVIVKDTPLLPGFAMCTYSQVSGRFMYSSRHKYECERAPVGIGDLITAAVTTGMLKYNNPVWAMDYANAIADNVMLNTCAKQMYEQDLIASMLAYVKAGKDINPGRVVQF